MYCTALRVFSISRNMAYSFVAFFALTSVGAAVTYTITTSWAGCPTTVAKNKTTYSNWVYTDAHAIQHSFLGSDFTEVQRKYTVAGHITYCGINTTTGFEKNSTDGVYHLKATGNIGIVTPVMITGFVNPKYVVVGVTYAPPGPNSTVTYESSYLVGNTTKITDGFGTGTTLSVSAEHGVGAWTVFGGAAGKVTLSESTEYTQNSSTSNEVTFSKQTGVKYTTSGTGDAFHPINHDYDTIWIWLNPLAVFSIDQSDPTRVQWNGWGYDKNDTNGPDIYGVQVGWLNGHWGANQSVQNVLARSWVTTTEPGMTWPSGEGPGLTSTDIVNILQADLFLTGYTLPTNPLPVTSADGRFTQIPTPPNPVSYTQAGPGNGGGTTTGYDLVNIDTHTVGHTLDHEFKQSFGIEKEFEGAVWLGQWKLNIKAEQSFSWKHSWENNLTTTKTLDKALSVTGPGCPQTSPPCVPSYADAGHFIVYQDNLYGTFMFYPKYD